MLITNEHAILSDMAYGNPNDNNKPFNPGTPISNTNWKVYKNYVQESSDFQGVIYKNTETGEYVYAIRGTQEELVGTISAA